MTLLADPEVDDVPVPKPVKKVKEVKPSRTIEPPLQPPTNLCVYDRKEVNIYNLIIDSNWRLISGADRLSTNDICSR